MSDADSPLSDTPPFDLERYRLLYEAEGPIHWRWAIPLPGNRLLVLMKGRKR